MTVRQAIIQILQQAKTPLKTSEILNLILENQLYTFDTDHPETIVNKALRRHCLDVRTDDARENKFFQEDPHSCYSLLPSPLFQDLISGETKPLDLSSTHYQSEEQSQTDMVIPVAQIAFKELISTLSKSAASAVSTPETPEYIKAIKEYLYVETEIEAKFNTWLKANTLSKKILFLCGSSGDGKSEILTRNQKKYQDSFDFHLDGTHSYHPSKSAIVTLDERFSEFKKAGRPLVVGINIGMLGNYAHEGNDEHDDVKKAIELYLGSRESSAVCEFLSFDDYPKYRMTNGEVQAPFVKELLHKITLPDDTNPFYVAYKNIEGRRGRKYRSIVNYQLLSIPEVRSVVVRAILQARLQFNLFLTARTLLDAIHHMLSDKGYLFDNIFSSSGGELLEALAQLDPNRERRREIDMFLIQQSLKIEDLDFISFQDLVAEQYGLQINDSNSWLRLCYVLQDLNISNKFHQRISDSFNQNTLKLYLDQWEHHSSYCGDRDKRKVLREFYNKTFLKALRRYANRRSPKLENQHFFLKEVNGYVFASQVTIEADFKGIENDTPRNLGTFNLRVLVEGKPLKPIVVNAGLFDLIHRINQGYRPNKYDKSAIVILEELIEEIQSIGNTLGQMVIEKKGRTSTVSFDEENEEITLEGVL
jgi:DNA phosphorothioation-dependent restriction protein DptF